MNAYEAYRWHHSIKRHFTSLSYDIISRKNIHIGNIKTNEDFSKQPYASRYNLIVNRLQKIPRVIRWFSANEIFNTDPLWNLEEAEFSYQKLTKQIESISYILEEDLNTINDLTEQLKITKMHDVVININNEPQIVKWYLSNKISYSSLYLIFDSFNLKDTWDIKDRLHGDLFKKLYKSSPFIPYNKNKIQEIINEKIKLS